MGTKFLDSRDWQTITETLLKYFQGQGAHPLKELGALGKF